MNARFKVRFYLLGKNYMALTINKKILSFQIKAGILSGPKALERFKFLMAILSSSIVKSVVEMSWATHYFLEFLVLYPEYF